MIYRWKWWCWAWWWFYFQFVICILVRWYLFPSCLFHHFDGKVAHCRSPFPLLCFQIYFYYHLHTLNLSCYRYLNSHCHLAIFQHCFIIGCDGGWYVCCGCGRRCDDDDETLVALLINSDTIPRLSDNQLWLTTLWGCVPYECSFFYLYSYLYSLDGGRLLLLLYWSRNGGGWWSIRAAAMMTVMLVVTLAVILIEGRVWLPTGNEFSLSFPWLLPALVEVASLYLRRCCHCRCYCCCCRWAPMLSLLFSFFVFIVVIVIFVVFNFHFRNCYCYLRRFHFSFSLLSRCQLRFALLYFGLVASTPL